MEKSPPVVQDKKKAAETLTKKIEKMAVEKKLITPTRRSKFQSLLNTTFFKIVLTVLLFSSLFIVAFVVSSLTVQKKGYIPTGPDIVPTAEIKIPTATPPAGSGQMLEDGCAIAGCNDELCVEQSQKESTVSACVYKDEFSCYKSAKCEVQSNGKCAWTQTEELKACLTESQQN